MQVDAIQKCLQPFSELPILVTDLTRGDQGHRQLHDESTNIVPNFI